MSVYPWRNAVSKLQHENRWAFKHSLSVQLVNSEG